jgi:hypothetical protein
VRDEPKRHLFRVPNENDAIILCKAGLTPRQMERHLDGAGLDYAGRKWKITTSLAAGLAVYYGLLTEDEADAAMRRLYE